MVPSAFVSPGAIFGNFGKFPGPPGEAKMGQKSIKIGPGRPSFSGQRFFQFFCANMSILRGETPFWHYLTALSGGRPRFLPTLTALWEVSGREKTRVAISILPYPPAFSRVGPQNLSFFRKIVFFRSGADFVQILEHFWFPWVRKM